MSGTAFYNEHDPFAAAWLRELIADGHIAPGIVDERSIEDLTPDDLRPFRQVHFFAGVGVWSLAARIAGIPDDAPLWTGSCPCQPFSAAGQGKGFADERHLWPAFHYLIEQCRPDIVVGEQVAGRGGDAWLDAVQADMEATGFAFGAVETVACGFGAPHKRSRNYWVAYAMRDGARNLTGESLGAQAAADRSYGRLPGQRLRVRVEGASSDLADPSSERHDGRRPSQAGVEPGAIERPERFRDAISLGDAPGQRRERFDTLLRPEAGGRFATALSETPRSGSNGGAGPTNGFWRDADWLRCRDEKWRPVEPGTFPLADAGAFRNRVGLIRGAGNAVTLGQAVGFLNALLAA